jgi:predicted Holliday junction resolvase-like endonuclease
MEQIALIVAYLIIAILIFVIAHFQRKARKQHNEISSAIVSITKNWVEHESYLKKKQQRIQENDHNKTNQAIDNDDCNSYLDSSIHSCNTSLSDGEAL